VDQCDIEKTNLKGRVLINNMKAYCELGWYTFRNAADEVDNHGKS